MQFALFYNKAGCVELNRAAAIHSFKRTGLEEKKGVKSKMAKDKMYGKTLRKNFARHEEIVEMPNLLALQKKSYQWFLDTGLREVFSDVASISNYAGNLELSFIDYKMDEAPKYDVLECKARDATYAAPLKVSVRLYNKETGEIKEQEIFMGDFPLMTESGTFVINGAERVVVSQLVRSPGIYYGKEIDLKTDLPLLTSTVIPYRGAWLEYETDANEMFWVRIDKNRKLPITCLIRALGVATDGQITEMFGEDPLIKATMDKDPCKTREESLLEIYRRLRPGEPPTVEASEGLIKNRYVGRTFIEPTQELRAMGVRMKLNPLRDNIEGKRLVVIDDSIVRGTTMVQLVKMLRNAGAKEIHIRINSPEVIWPCFYGIDTDVQSQLISANKTVDEICEYIGADSLAFLSVEGLLKVMPKGGYCDACFTGRYPVAIPESFGRDKFMEGFKPRNLDKPLYFDDDAVVEKYDDRSWEEEHGEA